MNRRDLLKILLPVGLGTTAAIAAFSQDGSGISPVRIALPDMMELVNFKQEFARVASNIKALLQVARNTDKLRIIVDIQVMKTPEAARRWPIVYNSGVQLKGGGLKRVLRSSRKIGQELWTDRRDDVAPFRIAAIDGRSVVTVSVEPYIGIDAKGFAVRHPHTQADMDLAENLAADVLERLTAMGLTSRPVSSASDKAKQQVRERLQRL